jgi:hypothetical protein
MMAVKDKEEGVGEGRRRRRGERDMIKWPDKSVLQVGV